MMQCAQLEYDWASGCKVRLMGGNKAILKLSKTLYTKGSGNLYKSKNHNYDTLPVTVRAGRNGYGVNDYQSRSLR